MRATFWLLDAPGSLAEQSRRNPDGYGIATFDEDGSPEVQKRPAAAYEDEQFAKAAREEESPTFVAHIRYASEGRVSLENTHPFEMEGRVFAHNGHLGGLEELDAKLSDGSERVAGDTDSERLFALITREIRTAGGDVEGGIERAVSWVADELPVFAVNFVLATATDVWALRYPEPHRLLMLERAIGGPTGHRHLDVASPAGTVRVRSGALADRAAVIFASEQMDEDAGWRGLEPGELVHVDGDLAVTSRLLIERPPANQLRIEDLAPGVAASQRDQQRDPVGAN
jgi:predicted glutamine amidotransferase